ncbi:hypothetical protein pipiens_003514 [Culex pipiens pipiens]|uniref:Uncharacterized protein n=1 Tax=Culex pipiens pipiens TaxID=38569 RepID=A0ABD1CWN1_CULPP
MTTMHRAIPFLLSVYATVDLAYRVFCALDIFFTPELDYTYKNTFYMCLHYMSGSLDTFLLYGVRNKNIFYMKAFKMGFLVLIPLLGVVRVHYAMDKPDDLQNVIIATGLSLTSIFVLYPTILKMVDGFIVAVRNGYDQSLDYSESVEPSPDPEKLSLV